MEGLSVNEKDVRRYSYSKYARSAAPTVWFCPWVSYGASRYKKRYWIFPTIFTLSCILMLVGFIFSIGVCEDNSRKLRGEIREMKAEARTIMEMREKIKFRQEMESNHSDLAQAEAQIDKYWEELQNEERKDYDIWKDKYVDAYNGFADVSGDIDSPLRKIEIKQTYYENQFYDFHGYEIKCYSVHLEYISDSTSYDTLYSKWANLQYIPQYKEEIEKLNIDVSIAEREMPTDERFAELTKQREMWGSMGQIGAYVTACGCSPLIGISGIVTIIIFALLAKPLPIPMQVEKEVKAGEGKGAKKDFINTLIARSKAKDVDGFNAELNAAHDRYEARKDIILTEKAFNKKLNELVSKINIAEGGTVAKQVKHRCKPMYANRDFEAFAEICAEYESKYESRKEIILTRKEYNAKVEKLVIQCAMTDGRDKAKQIKQQCKQLYKTRDFETFDILLTEYEQKAEQRKEQILKEQTTEQIELEYDGKSTFDGKLSQRIGWTVLGNIITVLTLGICYPIALCWKMRWEVNHTVYNGKRLNFDGTGAQLMGKWIVWSLLTVVTLGIYGLFTKIKLEQWKAKHTHIAGECKELGGTFDGNVLQRFGINLLCNILTVVTLGICYPFAQCIREKWNKKHTVYDGVRLGFDGNGMQLMGKYMLWWLLSVVTLGIYAQWVPIKLLKWKAEHTTLNEEREYVG